MKAKKGIGIARASRPAATGGFPSHMLNAHSRRRNRLAAKARQGAETAIDRFNEAQEDRVLHPTKGWRKLNVKRFRAQHIVAHILAGNHISTAAARRFIRLGW